ncbi:hypothetical protein BASA83_010674 [Batrachochytrium salamandrivorans]|nr:hypothetical protein BASA62_010215 [Batrachochytrium salamandrivorans]KAH9246129.1 hypothetical protein BASA81_016350 [Batrachochytrium salamandrivorans]KAH9266290.1 hypothetical protein BASA83_010674 [Batrachochytrium salamandrivorans]
MRAGIGIILSVLSFSVFAEVTSDYDYHGPLLVRRAVSPNNRAVLWKRSNDEQAGLGPSNSGAGTSTSNGGSNLDYSSDNRGPGKLDRFLGLLKRLYRFLKISWNTPKQKYIRWRDKRLIKAAVKKVAEIVDGENEKEFLSKIDEFLTTSLESVRMAFGLFDSKTKIPIFLLSIPEGKNQRSLTKEMVMIQTTGKKHTKEHLDEVLLAIAGIIKHPEDMVRELNSITSSASDTSTILRDLYRLYYKPLVSRVGHENNEENIKVTEQYISSLKRCYNGPWVPYNAILGEINSGKVTLKKKKPSMFANFKSQVKSRLGIKSKSSTGATSNNMPSKKDIDKILKEMFG